MKIKKYEVMHVNMRHESGTKDYDIFIIENVASGKALMIRRWGRIGSVLGTITKQFGAARPAGAYAKKIIDDKSNRGYKPNAKYYQFDEDELVGFIPSNIWSQVPAADAAHISSDLEAKAPAPKPAQTPAPKPAPAVQLPSHYGSW